MRKKNITLSGLVLEKVNGFVLLLLATLTLYPFLYVAAISFSSNNYVIAGYVKILPIGFTLKAYFRIFESNTLLLSLVNSIIITVVGTVISMLITTLIAYPLSKNDLKWKGKITLFMVFTMWFSGGLIPSFILYYTIGIYNTWWVLWLPGAVSVFNLLIIRNGFEGIPSEMEESAIIDGANHLQIFYKIYLPLAKATLAAMTLFYAVTYWNQFLSPILFISNRRLWPAQPILREIIASANIENLMKLDVTMDPNEMIATLSMQGASIIVVTIPILIVFPFLQKHFTKGVMLGSVKG